MKLKINIIYAIKGQKFGLSILMKGGSLEASACLVTSEV